MLLLCLAWMRIVAVVVCTYVPLVTDGREEMPPLVLIRLSGALTSPEKFAGRESISEFGSTSLLMVFCDGLDAIRLVRRRQQGRPRPRSVCTVNYSAGV